MTEEWLILNESHLICKKMGTKLQQSIPVHTQILTAGTQSHEDLEKDFPFQMGDVQVPCY